MTLDRFYPIFEDAAWIARMLRQGTKFVQIRIKNKRTCKSHQISISTYDGILGLSQRFEPAGHHQRLVSLRPGTFGKIKKVGP